MITHNALPTSSDIENSIRTERWNRMILRQELAQLKREREHLSSKKLERTLTQWEISRLSSIADEIMELLGRFSSHMRKSAVPGFRTRSYR